MKVALCFIISYQHILNKEQLWIDWIKPNQDIINVYFHYKDIAKIKSPWIKMYSIPPECIQNTTYYNVVPAYMSLLYYAFNHDLENKWFCMLSDSCVPIISPSKFRKLFFANYYASIFNWKTAYWNINIHRRANLRLLKKEYWLANDPWFTLSRAHVQKCLIFMVANNNIYKKVNDGGLANESMFAIMLQTFDELLNSKWLIKEPCTITDWSRMSSPTSPYLFSEATEENINIIVNQLKENKYLMFLRKVDRGFPDQSILNIMDQDLNAFKSESDSKMLVPIEHGYYICIMSTLFFLSGIYAVKRGLFISSIGPLVVFINSINYWRRPTYGLRRNIDICWCLFALIIQMYNSHLSIYYFMYRCIMLCSLLFYPLGWILYKKKYFWFATIAHSMIHVGANVANVVLYAGM